jgi:antitoxin component of MazEF toxin-antitoxin module
MLIKKIVKRGDSSYVLMPKDILDMLHLSIGDSVHLTVKDNKIIVSPIKKSKEVKTDDSKGA